MTFSLEQVELLKAPLSRESVKTRSQSGRTLSYVEGWKAIAEANRIFGFDGWTRETVDLKMVAEHERPIGQAGAKGWGVTYIARVRVCIIDRTMVHGAFMREGCGTGHGIDRDLGQAHESALKEAETDAMKRALMTFGNPFGLALYDKEQNEVEGEPKPPLRDAIHGASTLKPQGDKHPSAPLYAPSNIVAPPHVEAKPVEIPKSQQETEAREWGEWALPRVKTMDKDRLDKFQAVNKKNLVTLKALDPKTSIELEKALAARLEELFA